MSDLPSEYTLKPQYPTPSDKSSTPYNAQSKNTVSMTSSHSSQTHSTSFTDETPVSDALGDQLWYHGLLPRSEIEELLKNEGNWLVRCVYKSDGKVFVITVKLRGEILHLKLVEERRGGFIIANKKFNTIPELIKHYRETGQVLSSKQQIVITGSPIKRPRWLIRTRDVIKQHKIGEGAFGEVYTGIFKYKGQEFPCAIKTMNTLAADRKATDEFICEAKRMLYYHHKNVVRFYGVAADETPILLVMELCPAGSLEKFLKQNRGFTHIKQKIQMCLDAARGMTYLAVKKQCVHKDLAARNCLIGVKGEVKISDFGLSQHGTSTELEKNAKIAVKWVAPEVITTHKCTFESDVWNFATMMWEILSDGVEPWEDYSVTQAVIAMRKGQKLVSPLGTPAAVEKLMHHCWNLEPKQRPTMEQVRDELERIVASGDDKITYSAKYTI